MEDNENPDLGADNDVEKTDANASTQRMPDDTLVSPSVQGEQRQEPEPMDDSSVLIGQRDFDSQIELPPDLDEKIDGIVQHNRYLGENLVWKEG